MWPKTAFAERLGLALPIIQAPMAGGITEPELVAAVSEAGGLGSIGAAALSPSALRNQIKAVRASTRRPFAVNLFLPSPEDRDPEAMRAANQALAGYRQELGLPTPNPNRFQEDYDAQLAVVREERVPVFSFTLGAPDAATVEALHALGTTVIGTATTVDEAVALKAVGVECIVAQGGEAGGHRGSFLRRPEDCLVGTLALVPQVVDAVDLPVIAAGGIMDGRGIAAALALGASGVQMGTAFLACPEAGSHPAHKQAVLSASEDATALTAAFSGKPARGIRNRFIDEMATAPVASFPIQNALTSDIRRAAAEAGRPEFLSMWAGQGLRLSRDLPAAELVAALDRETRQVLARLNDAVTA